MNRISQLDSLRGLAALTVLFGHYLNVLPQIILDTKSLDGYQGINLIKYTPLHIFWAGYAAVILFFVLSGFVLSLPFYRENNKFSYLTFMIKRFFRIYVPYIVSVFIAVLAAILISKGGISELSTWFNGVWEKPFKWEQINDHFLFLGNFNYGAFNPIYWSLVYEMRISIIFPFIVLLMVRSNWFYNILLAFVFLFLGVYFITNQYLITLFYVFMFIVGALLAKHRVKIQAYTQTKSKNLKLVYLLIGICLYTYEHWAHYLYLLVNINLEYKYHWMLVGIFTTAGCVIFIILSLSSLTLTNVLLKKPIQFLGKISYSFYLYHCVALFSLTYLLYDYINLFVIWLLSLILTILLATIGYYLIEEPSIRLARLIVNKVPKRKNKVKTETLKHVRS